MKQTVLRILQLTLGWICILVGIVGLFVPILQGILFILVGLWLLSRESRMARRCLRKVRMRFPAADRKLKSLQHRFSDFFHHRTGESGNERREPGD